MDHARNTPHIYAPGRSGAPLYEEYDDQYPQVFDAIVLRIYTILPGTPVEHVGSTAVPGLGGRRSLDIVLPVGQERIDGALAQLRSIGFINSPFQHFLPMLLGVIQYDGKEYGIILYVLSPENPVYQGLLAVRNYMRQHPAEVQRFITVKRQAIAVGSTRPGSYQQAKTTYFVNLAQKIGGNP